MKIEIACQLPISRDAARRTMTFFAAANKISNIVAERHCGVLRYSRARVNIYFTNDDTLNPEDKDYAIWVSEEDTEYPESLRGKYIAYVRYNCILMRDPESQEELAAVLNASVALLEMDYDGDEDGLPAMTDEQSRKVLNAITRRTTVMLGRLDTAADDLRCHVDRLERELVEKRSDLRRTDKLRKTYASSSEYIRTSVAVRERKLIRDLIKSGQYEGVDFTDDGTMVAITSPVSISWEGYSLPMGKYQITLTMENDLRVLALEHAWSTKFNHPHINAQGSCCLGNLRDPMDLMMEHDQLSGILMALRHYLEKYNPDDKYVELSEFDPNGDIPRDDPVDDCENCDNQGTPHCLHECEHSNGGEPDSCCDFNSGECRHCQYLGSGSCRDVDPCEGCCRRYSPLSKANACFECEVNENWKRRSICRILCGEYKRTSECRAKECKFLPTREDLINSGDIDRGEILSEVEESEGDQPGPAVGGAVGEDVGRPEVGSPATGGADAVVEHAATSGGPGGSDNRRGPDDGGAVEPNAGRQGHVSADGGGDQSVGADGPSGGRAGPVVPDGGTAGPDEERGSAGPTDNGRVGAVTAATS